MPFRSAKVRRVSATQIAALGHCELKVVLERRHGEKVTEVQRAARQRGNQEHVRFDRLATQHHNRPGSTRPSPCFVATAVYGQNCSRTNELRAFRDRTLRRTRTGRELIATYYRCSPPIARWLRTSPRATNAVRVCLDVIRAIIRSMEGH